MPQFLSGRAAHYLLIVAAGCALTLPNLGGPSLWDIDEGLNAEAAREMLESGNYVVPTFNFQLRTAKPALLYWLQTAAYRGFGVSEFAARLPSALLALLTMLLAYETGRRLFDRLTGLLAAVVLGGTVQFGVLAHAATPDMTLLACLTLTFWLFAAGFAGGRDAGPADGWWWVPVGAAAGLAFLAKGPVGLALPAAVFVPWLVWCGRGRLLLDPRLAAGVVMFLLVAAPWYVLVGLETRGAFPKAFFLRENVGRFGAPMENHGGPPVYYLAALAVGFAPWSAFLPAGLWCAWRAEPDRRPAYRLLGLWFGVCLAAFSAAGTKLPSYVLPLYPPAALLTARFLVRWLRGELVPARGVVPAGFAGVALTGVVAAAGLLAAGGWVPLPPKAIGRPFPGLVARAWVGAVPVIAAALALAWMHSRRGPALAAAALGGTAFTALTAALAVAPVDEAKSPRPLVAAAGACRPDREVRLAAYGWFQPSVVFYARREVVQLPDRERLAEYLACPLPAWLFLPAADWAELAGPCAATHAVVARHWDLYRKCEVVAVANRAAAALPPRSPAAGGVR